MRHNLVHAVASDAHSADFRRPVLSEAYGVAADFVGRKKAEDLLITIPQAIVEGRDIPVQEPVIYPHPEAQKRKWLTRLFRSGNRE